MNIGTAIKAIRKRLDITQFQLADACDISQATLSQIESGKKRPNQHTIKAICTCLDIPEAIIYIIAMEEKDVPETKRGVYNLIYPSMMSLSLEMLSSQFSMPIKKNAVAEEV